MARKSPMSDDQNPFASEYFHQYHSMVKSQFLEDSTFSHEETHACIANIDENVGKDTASIHSNKDVKSTFSEEENCSFIANIDKDVNKGIISIHNKEEVNYNESSQICLVESYGNKNIFPESSDLTNTTWDTTNEKGSSEWAECFRHNNTKASLLEKENSGNEPKCNAPERIVSTNEVLGYLKKYTVLPLIDRDELKSIGKNTKKTEIEKRQKGDTNAKKINIAKRKTDVKKAKKNITEKGNIKGSIRENYRQKMKPKLSKKRSSHYPNNSILPKARYNKYNINKCPSIELKNDGVIMDHVSDTTEYEVKNVENKMSEGIENKTINNVNELLPGHVSNTPNVGQISNSSSRMYNSLHKDYNLSADFLPRCENDYKLNRIHNSLESDHFFLITDLSTLHDNNNGINKIDLNESIELNVDMSTGYRHKETKDTSLEQLPASPKVDISPLYQHGKMNSVENLAVKKNFISLQQNNLTDEIDLKETPGLENSNITTASDVAENIVEEEEEKEDPSLYLSSKSDESTIPAKLKESRKLLKLKQVTEWKPKNKKNLVKKMKVFKCNACGKVFKIFKSWHRHMSSHSTPCNFCKALFTDFDKYVRHVREDHAILPVVNITKLHENDTNFFTMKSLQSGRSICILCNRKFLTREKCTEHIMDCHSYDVFKWKDTGVIKKHLTSFFLKKFAFATNCPMCKLYFEKESDFHNHMESYHCSHAFCFRCNKYVFNSEIPKHEKRHTKEERESAKANIEYSCDCCQFSSSSSESFAQHLNPVNCSYCTSARFCNEKELMLHQLEDHAEHVFGVCYRCDHSFLNLSDLIQHMVNTHSFLFNASLYICDLCFEPSLPLQRLFTNKSIKTHMLSHCILSHSQLFSPLEQGSHIDLIIPSNSLNIFHIKCTLCPIHHQATYACISSFSLHLSICHSNEFVGFCISCDFKIFHSNEALLHAVTEHFTCKESQLECLICGLCYDTPESALVHILSRHVLLLGQIPPHLKALFSSSSVTTSIDVCSTLNQRAFTCDHCAFDTNGLLSYISHLNIKHNILHVRLKCNICLTPYESFGSFVGHKCCRAMIAVPTARTKHFKATLMGAVTKSPTTSHRNEIFQGKYTGICGEHSYASLSLTNNHAMIQLVLQEHDYSL